MGLLSACKTFSAFKSFKDRVEKEANASIICLRTNRDGEFTFEEFANYYKHRGISRQKTTTYTPQENEVAKRKNRIILDAVWVVLQEKHVPKLYWPNVVRWCVHVQNRSHHLH